MIKLSVAYTNTFLIGIETMGKFIMPWTMPSDLQHFKEYTMGTTLVMGSNTWRSIGCRPLPGRRHIIHTRDPKVLAKESAEVNIKVATNDNVVFANLFPEETWVGYDSEALMDRLKHIMSSTGKAFEEEDVTIAGGSFIYKSFLSLELVDEMALTILVSPSEDSLVEKHWTEGPEPTRQHFPKIDMTEFKKFGTKPLNGEKDEFPATVFFYQKIREEVTA